MDSPELDTPDSENRNRVRAVVCGLSKCLRELDTIDEGVAAVHVSMALDILRRDYGLEL